MNTGSQLKVSLDDLINAREKGFVTFLYHNHHYIVYMFFSMKNFIDIKCQLDFYVSQFYKI